MDKKIKIKSLEQSISKAQVAYYNDSSIIDDDTYDAMIYELSCLDPKNKLLGVVGAEVTSGEWKKEKHLFTLGSLDKVNTPEDMSKWINKVLTGQDKSVLVVEKLDGLSIGCQYENGKLIKAILRGGGVEGEDILENVVKMHGAVKNIPDFTGVLRGEIMLTKTNHMKHFPSYSNPRNAASGLCRKKDGDHAQHLTVMFYQVLGKEFASEEEQFKFLEKQKCLVPNYKTCKNTDEVSAMWRKYQDTTRKSLDYEIDGLVVSISDIALQQSLGENSHHPKGKLAFKFSNQFVATTVKEITWTTGNSGRITPVCWFESVNLLGSNVEKASVYNVEYLTKLGLDVGAQVLICKAGEIIPRVEKVIQSTNTIAKIPTNCPTCEAKLESVGEYLQCPNVGECAAQVAGRIKNWIDTLNILEVGETLIERLVESGKVKAVADLYTLTVPFLGSLERMGQKSAQKAYDNLWAEKEISLEYLIGGLSIPMIGVSSIKLVVESGYDSLDKIFKMTIEDFEKINGLGPRKAESLVKGLKDYKEVIEQILKNGIKIKERTVGKLTNMSFAFTGAMEHKRTELEKMVADAGGSVKSVGKGLDMLVIADPENSTSSKAVKARKLGTKLISEEEFIKMVKS